MFILTFQFLWWELATQIMSFRLEWFELTIWNCIDIINSCKYCTDQSHRQFIAWYKSLACWIVLNHAIITTMKEFTNLHVSHTGQLGDFAAEISSFPPEGEVYAKIM